MRVRMTNPAFPMGEANVLPDDVPVWEAAGWVADPAKKTSAKKDNDE